MCLLPSLITCGMITCYATQQALMHTLLYTSICMLKQRPVIKEVFAGYISPVHVLHNQVNQYVADLCCKHVQIVL